MQVYKVNGPIPPGHPSYTVRLDVESDALNRLRAGDYLQIIEPRQQGKTSFINRLYSVLDGQVLLVYIPVQALDRSTEQGWYRSLCDHILNQLDCPNGVDPEQLPKEVKNHAQWDSFLRQLASVAPKPVILLLDEIGAAAKFAGAPDFFATLRAVYTSRVADKRLDRITFVLAGAVDPAILIAHGGVSDPFTVAGRVRLRDFSIDEVRSLVKMGPWPRISDDELTNRVYAWTEGHPQLTQLLCSRLDATADSRAVDECVEVLRREGEVHLRTIRVSLEENPQLHEYFDRILRGERIHFYPEEVPLQRELQLLGVIKGDPQFCQVRTEIYRLVFAKPDYDVFISYRRRGGDAAANTIKSRLDQDQVRVFLDVSEMRTGLFSTQICRTIDLAPIFVPVLSVGCLDTCKEPQDWMRLEIAHALRQQKHIVPAIMNGFEFPPDLPEEIAQLPDYQAVNFGEISFDDALKRLCDYVKELLNGLPR